MWRLSGAASARERGLFPSLRARGDARWLSYPGQGEGEGAWPCSFIEHLLTACFMLDEGTVLTWSFTFSLAFFRKPCTTLRPIQGAEMHIHPADVCHDRWNTCYAFLYVTVYHIDLHILMIITPRWLVIRPTLSALLKYMIILTNIPAAWHIWWNGIFDTIFLDSNWLTQTFSNGVDVTIWNFTDFCPLFKM